MKLSRLAPYVGALSALAAMQVQAAPITVPAEISDATASVALVGAAVFAIAVGIKLYKWITRAL